MECPWPVREGWESFKSYSAGTFVYPINFRSRKRQRNLWDKQRVSSWWPLDWFGYLHELYIDIWFTLKCLTDGGSTCFICLDWWADGERDGLWWPVLSGHWLSCTGCCRYLINMKCCVTHICVSKLYVGSDNCLSPGRRQAIIWHIVNSNLRNKLQWNLKRNSCVFIQENEFENVVCEMAFILSRPQFVKEIDIPTPINCHLNACYS